MSVLARGLRLLPPGLRDWFRAAAREPRTPLQRVVLRAAGFRSRPVPDPPPVPHSETSVYIAPANYAGQGWTWARALERAQPGLEAWNMEVRPPGGFGFDADRVVGLGAFHLSEAWQNAEFEAAAARSHVMIEATRPIFGAKFGYDVAAEVSALQERGVAVAMMAHGSDIRNPRTHRELTRWSPFHDAVEQTDRLQRISDVNRPIMLGSGARLFVSTPELMTDLPGALWCPVVVDVDRWGSASTPIGSRSKPVVVHAPTNAWIKGSDLIAPAADRLHEAGLIDYRALSGIPVAEMPRVLGNADIVLEQFRLGIYATTAIEAMAAGRVVVAHVADDVRRHVREVTGLDLPVIEADPGTVGSVLERLIADPDEMRRIGDAGVRFSRVVHDGTFSARVLQENWIRPQG